MATTQELEEGEIREEVVLPAIKPFSAAHERMIEDIEKVLSPRTDPQKAKRALTRIVDQYGSNFFDDLDRIGRCFTDKQQP